jgi:hypothetical protein
LGYTAGAMRWAQGAGLRPPHDAKERGAGGRGLGGRRARPERQEGLSPEIWTILDGAGQAKHRPRPPQGPPKPRPRSAQARLKARPGPAKVPFLGLAPPAAGVNFESKCGILGYLSGSLPPHEAEGRDGPRLRAPLARLGPCAAALFHRAGPSSGAGGLAGSIQGKGRPKGGRLGPKAGALSAQEPSKGER